jgi:hypothetical protein
MADQSLVFPSLSTHFYQSIYRLENRLYAYQSPNLNHTPIGGTSVKHMWQNRLNYSGSSALLIAVQLQSA